MGLLDEFYAPDYSRLKRGQFRQDTPKMREYAANVPIDLLRGRLAGLLGLPSDVANMFRTLMPTEMMGGPVDYQEPTQVPYGTDFMLKNLPLAPAADNPLGRVAGQAGALVPLTPMEIARAARLAGRGATEVGKFVAPKAGQLAENYMQSMGMMPGIIERANPNTVLINPKNLKPLNKVEDIEKYKTILNSMEESGYQGRPILAYMDKGRAKALTGSHRIFAARKAGIDVPVVFVKPSVMKWEDQSGQFGTFKESIDDQRVYNHLKAAGDDIAASLSKLEEPGIVSKEGGGLLGDAAATKAPNITKKSQSVISQPRMSAAEARDAGYWHSIGAGKKLPIPISEMTARLENAGLLSPKLSASPEAMQGGAIFPFHGDRSAAGKNLLGIGDTNFETPVYLEGGYDFMRANAPNREIWAADKGSAQGLQNRIDEAAKIGGGDVFGVYSAMGPDSMNFNTMMSDALLEQIRAGKISKKNISAFDREVASLRPEWKGVMNPESRAQLESNGALRHVFVNRMQLDDFQKVGFPNIAYTRYGITDPLLLNEPMYSGGLAVGKMQPGSNIITNPMSPHKTYNTQLAGDYIGGFEQSVPKEVLYPDWYKKRRIDNTPISGDVRSFQLSNPIQPTNQEWLDGVMQYLANQKSLLE